MSGPVEVFKAGIGPAVASPVIWFDLGNILVHLHTVDAFWEGQTPEPGTLPFAERWSQSFAVHELEKGRLADFTEFYHLVRSEMGFSMPLARFEPAFIHIIGEVFAETHGVLEALYGHFPLMLMSNTSAAHWHFCRDVQGLGRYFDQTFLSYELGCMKPDPQIFELALARIDQVPENIYYFDDRPDNVETALKFGINAHLSWGGGPLIKQLQELSFLQ
jgi:FMN phosphatase YigB (HAD superfamily)